MNISSCPNALKPVKSGNWSSEKIRKHSSVIEVLGNKIQIEFNEQMIADVKITSEKGWI